MEEIPVGINGNTERSEVNPSFVPLLDVMIQTLRKRMATNLQGHAGPTPFTAFGVSSVRLPNVEHSKFRFKIYHFAAVFSTVATRGCRAAIGCWESRRRQWAG